MRAGLLAVRRSVPVEERRRRDRAIAVALSPLVRGVVAAFAPLSEEPSGRRAYADARCLLLPVLSTSNDLDWAVAEGELAPGRFRLMEPVGPRLGVDAVLSADLLIVPALAVDPRGHRLGRGGGSYDRVLARVAGTVPALAVIDDTEVVPEVPVEPHDVAVQGYVTPGGVHWVRS